MSAVNEWVVREYFELLGYFVNQPCKFIVPGRPKTAEEEVDLVICHPRITEHVLPDGIVWTTKDLQTVSRAIVGICGAHSERFYASSPGQVPDVLSFVHEDSIRYASRLLGTDQMARILCLPKLPASGDLRKQTIDVLKSMGVTGIISFETILMELIRRVDAKRNYEKSDLLQVLRLLKNYDFLKSSQMDLFEKKRRKRRKSVAPPRVEGVA